MKPIRISPDGAHYLRMGSDGAAPHPYCRRWLLPRLLGSDPQRWVWLTHISLAATPSLALVYFFSMGLPRWQAAFAAALLCSLPGLRLPRRLPVLTDAPAFALTLAVASLAASGHPWAAAYLALPLGAMRESGPVFAALWAWHPVPLIGLVAVRLFPVPRLIPPDPSEPWLAKPFAYALALRQHIGLDRGLYVTPWGAALLGLAVPTWQMAAAVLVAHAQLFVAVDTLRLTVWAAPVLVLGAAKIIPPAWWTLAIVATAVHQDARA